MVPVLIDLPVEALKDICLRHHVRELALFGSALRGTFTAESDIDLLVEFEPSAVVGYLELFQMEDELSKAAGRKVDLVPREGLNPAIRDEVLAQAMVIYATGDSVPA